MGKTFANPIKARDVSLAIERFLVAPEGTTWTPARVDIDAPPTGFIDLGPVDEESPTVTITRGQFQLRTGLPQVLQFQAVTSVDARIAFNLQTRDTRAAIYALGSVPNNAAKYVSSVSPTTIGGTPTATHITLTASPSNDWFVGDEIITAVNTSSIMSSQNYATISSIDGLDVYFNAPGFPTAPAVNDVALKPEANYVPFGTAFIPAFTMLGVADFMDNYQLVHYFKKVQASAEFVENIRSSENIRMPLQFDVFGLPDPNWNNELVLGERYLFQKNA